MLERYGVELLGTPIETIRLAEDRERFKRKMLEIGEPVPESAIVTEIDQGVAFAERVGYPLVVRPAYTLAGTGGGVVYNEAQLRETLDAGLNASLIHQALFETSLLGWKEIEYEVLRDGGDNCIVVCNMENIDPVGVHTGDSIVVAPSQTLSDLEYQMLRTASINVIRALDVQGGCNIQFALHPRAQRIRHYRGEPARLAQLGAGVESDRLSDRQDRDADRARAAARRDSKSGHRRHEGRVRADARLRRRQDPALAVRQVSDRRHALGTQMKSTGEAMGIGRTFRAALLKAVRGLDLGRERRSLDRSASGATRNWKPRRPSDARAPLRGVRAPAPRRRSRTGTNDRTDRRALGDRPFLALRVRRTRGTRSAFDEPVRSTATSPRRWSAVTLRRAWSA